jgi:hypothetical protein
MAGPLPRLFAGTEWFFRTGYHAHLPTEWIPALDGAEDKLRQLRGWPADLLALRHKARVPSGAE